MTRREQSARVREARAMLAALRDAVEHDDGRVHTTDRRLRRMVARGWVADPQYTYGAARDAVGQITAAGRAHVAGAGS